MANVKGTYGDFACIPGPNGELLLVRRSDGRWNYPGGGVDELDASVSRTIEEVVAREVEEETGLKVRFADHRPVGSYATDTHTDRATTWLCKVIGGSIIRTPEGTEVGYFSPTEVMEMARKGDAPDGLVGGLKTSTGRVPRHIQMCLHYFTRVCLNEMFRRKARLYCQALGIPE